MVNTGHTSCSSRTIPLCLGQWISSAVCATFCSCCSMKQCGSHETVGVEDNHSNTSYQPSIQPTTHGDTEDTVTSAPPALCQTGQHLVTLETIHQSGPPHYRPQNRKAWSPAVSWEQRYQRCWTCVGAAPEKRRLAADRCTHIVICLVKRSRAGCRELTSDQKQ